MNGEKKGKEGEKEKGEVSVERGKVTLDLIFKPKIQECTDKEGQIGNVVLLEAAKVSSHEYYKRNSQKFFRK
jgi:hypothetical protein